MSALAVVFLDGLLVDDSLVGKFTADGSCTEECFLVKYVDIVIYKGDELVIAIVGELNVCNEPCAAELWKDVVCKSLVHC